MNQAPAHQAGAQPNGMGAAQQQQLANGASSAAIDASQKQQYLKIDVPNVGLRIELRQPITFNGQPYQRMQFREVNMTDAALIEDKGETNETMAEVFSSMTNNAVPPGVFLLMPLRELAVIKDFFLACALDFHTQD